VIEPADTGTGGGAQEIPDRRAGGGLAARPDASSGGAAANPFTRSVLGYAAARPGQPLALLLAGAATADGALDLARLRGAGCETGAAGRPGPRPLPPVSRVASGMLAVEPGRAGRRYSIT
jgi:hypothetical protein